MQWTSKVGLYASAGVEFRQFDGNRDTYDSPVFEVGLSYNPFSGTFISLAAGRRIYNSGYSPNQDFASTYVVGRFQQRLFHRFYFGLGAGYENSDYFATDRDTNATRNEDYWFIEPSVDVLITRWLSAGVYYLHRERQQPTKISSVGMIIRSAFGRRSGFKQGLNRLRAGTEGWLAIALALSLPGFMLAQTMPGTAASQPAATSTSRAAASAPASTGGVSAPAGYILSPNDQVAVEVFGEDDLRTSGRLNPEGNLSVPLLGSIHLAGLTLTQAVSKLTELYSRDYLVNPKINVTLLSYARRRFSILGQVNRPGSIEMPESSPEGIDLLEAIALAGGYTRIASPERITVRRQDASGDHIFKVNAKRFTKGKGGGFLVEPGDTINVGESIF